MSEDSRLSRAHLLKERAFYRRLLALGAQDALEPLLAEALALITDVTGVTHAYIELHRDDPGAPRWWTAHGCSQEALEQIRRSISRGIIAEAIATGETITTISAQEDPRFEARVSVRDHHIEAVLCAPIGVPAIGVLYLQGRATPGPFSRTDRERAEDFAFQLSRLTDRLIARAELSEQEDHTRAARARFPAPELIGRSAALAAALQRGATAARRDVIALITGATGTGKTALARAIAGHSARAEGPFVSLNCAALPESLLESELFGFRAGAHSTAHRDQPGKVAAAEGGVLFLDEIGELSLASQAKLLQLLEARVYFPVGGAEPVTADIRVLAASNRDLEAMVAERSFRSDLYYRLKVLRIHMPSLEERREDIPLLAAHFAARHGESLLGRPVALSRMALLACAQRPWPGNLRELSACIESAVAGLPDDRVSSLERGHLFPEDAPDAADASAAPLSYQEATRAFQRQLLQETLDALGWNVAEAARSLQVARSHLYNLIREHGLKRVR